eukprot:6447215-Amphidinium_carterae.1
MFGAWQYKRLLVSLPASFVLVGHSTPRHLCRLVIFDHAARFAATSAEAETTNTLPERSSMAFGQSSCCPGALCNLDADLLPVSPLATSWQIS